MLSLAYYLLSIFFWNIVFCGLVTFVYVSFVRILKGRWPRLNPSLTWYFLFILAWFGTLGLLNYTLFPLSTLTRNFDLLFIEGWRGKVLVGSIVLSAAIPSVSVIASLARRAMKLIRMKPATISMATISVPLIAGIAFPIEHQAPIAGKNIILIGVDSLRPDAASAYAEVYPNSAISRLFHHGVRFQDTLTPLARTFPSYMSIYTGKYPINHQARFNLFPRDHFDESRTLASLLSQNSYHTAYITDESRFANIDRSFGFNETHTPTQGALDFIVGSSFESLATNLLLEIPLLSNLFPQVLGNRGAYKTYQPTHFSRRLLRAVNGLPKHKPVFLSVHFCLPHFPYAHSAKDLNWSHPAFNKFRQPKHGPSRVYFNAIDHTSGQLNVLMAALKDQGLLENALVVFLSDHGESLGLDSDVLKTTSTINDEFRSYSHGGFGLAREQNQVVLTFQEFKNGEARLPVTISDYPASVLDIAPTILANTGIDSQWLKPDGTPLPLMAQRSDTILRYRFIETGLSGPLVEKAEIDVKAVADEYSHLYQIADDLRLEVSPKVFKQRFRLKQRGVSLGDKALIAWHTETNHCWLLADYRLRTAECVNPNSSPESQKMQLAICRHFKKDTDFIQEWCQA